ncbi:UDP-N-acetylglucosamine transferase subunit ALG14 homolog [Amyelois transitella]|uniref:UDP-N-acetylglucosamine transferase subunit ALG14 homolog n=1 Tax=Amyelois transitella TaxID=680683 RepID=UPI00067CAAD1|nr:UDP-N-acetylglucosamine transferase subunit ALG14 homolog [Amyelois transitella]
MSIYEISILISTVLCLILLRVLYVLLKIYTTKCDLQSSHDGLRTILCLGSGGHTTELLRLVKSLNCKKYNPRLYIIANNDKSSEVKMHSSEISQKDYSFTKIPRSRNVKQSYSSSVLSTLHAFTRIIPIVYGFKPDIIFCNGPGTCVPLCVVAFVLRCLFLIDCRIVFVESVCRVRTLSLTGKILQLFADIFVVQWPQLRNDCFRAKYFGRLT